MATLACGICLAEATTLTEGTGTEVTGWFSAIYLSRNLWLSADQTQIAVNLDDFGGRRAMICQKLLDPANSRRQRIFGVLVRDQIKIAAEFIPGDQHEYFGFVEVREPKFSIRYLASRFQPDVMEGVIQPAHPERFGFSVSHISDPNFRRVLKLRAHLEGGEDWTPVKFAAMGRVWNDGRAMTSDAISLEIRRGPYAGAHLVQVTGEVVPSRDRLRVITRSGYRLALRRGEYLPRRFADFGVPNLDRHSRYQTLTLTGLLRPGAPLRVFLRP